MPVSLDLLRNNRVIRITSAGELSRAETLHAYLQVRDLIVANDARCVLIDARDVEITGSPQFAMEFVEAFVDIIERPLPIAFLPPLAWTDAHYSAGWAMAKCVANETGVFKTPELAIDWLDIQLSA